MVNTFSQGEEIILTNEKVLQVVQQHTVLYDKTGDDILGRDYIIHRTYDNKGGHRDTITNNYDLYETDKVILSPREVKRRLRESSYYCKIKNILLLKNKTLQAEFFRKIETQRDRKSVV